MIRDQSIGPGSQTEVLSSSSSSRALSAPKNTSQPPLDSAPTYRRLQRFCIKMCSGAYGCLKRCNYESDVRPVGSRVRVLKSLVRQVAWLLLSLSIYAAGIALVVIGIEDVSLKCTVDFVSLTSDFFLPSRPACMHALLGDEKWVY